MSSELLLLPQLDSAADFLPNCFFSIDLGVCVPLSSTPADDGDLLRKIPLIPLRFSVLFLRRIPVGKYHVMTSVIEWMTNGAYLEFYQLRQRMRRYQSPNLPRSISPEVAEHR